MKKTKLKLSLHRSLFIYMLILTIILIILIYTGVFILGQYQTPKTTTSDNFKYHLNVFKQEIEDKFEKMAMMQNDLAKSSSKIIEDYLNENSLTINDLDNLQSDLLNIQKLLLDKLSTEIYKADASGGFILLNATVNNTLENAKTSRSGIYVQRASTDLTNKQLLLYRGNKALCDNSTLSLHRQWRLEFNTENISNYQKIIDTATSSKKYANYINNLVVLQGTEDKNMEFITPILSSDYQVLGICGFEISDSYFKAHFKQASQIDSLIFIITSTIADDYILMSDSFCVGVNNGNSIKPTGFLSINKYSNPLVELYGDTSYIGLLDTVSLSQEASYKIGVMVPESYYSSLVNTFRIKLVTIITLFVLLIGTLLLFFSKQYLSPLIKGIAIIKEKQHSESSSYITEIDDLFNHLTKQDKENDEQINNLLNKIDETVESLYETKNKVERLAYSRKNEIDPDDYDFFKEGIGLLTKTEKQIFDAYVNGLTKDEILLKFDIKASTLKFHTHNILSKLNVKNLKEMLRYTTIMNEKDG